jgi:two-component system, response regulator PdtaR
MMLQEIEPHRSQLSLAAADQSDDERPEQRRNPTALGMRQLRVLVVEDEFFISLTTKRLLEDLGHVVVGIAVSADDAVKVAAAERPDVVLMDIRLIGSRDGIDAAEEIRRRFDIGSIFVTANSDPETQRRAQVVQPLGFLEKPLTEQRLQLGLSALMGH